MGLIKDPSDLPEKISGQLPGRIVDGYIGGIKTALKPNATIPILWMILYEDGFLFCSTHRTRGIFKDISRNEINSIKIRKSAQFEEVRIEYIFKDLTLDDFVVAMPNGTDVEEIRTILTYEKYQVL